MEIMGGVTLSGHTFGGIFNHACLSCVRVCLFMPLHTRQARGCLSVSVRPHLRDSQPVPWPIYLVTGMLQHTNAYTKNTPACAFLLCLRRRPFSICKTRAASCKARWTFPTTTWPPSPSCASYPPSLPSCCATTVWWPCRPLCLILSLAYKAWI